MTAKIFRNAFLIGFTVLLACILLFFFIMYSNYQAQANEISAELAKLKDVRQEKFNSKAAIMLEREEQEENGFNQTVIDGMTGFVFVNRNGGVPNPQAINRTIKRIAHSYNSEEVVKAKRERREPIILPDFSCHHLRHTFCTRLCEHETNLKVIQAIMGHRNIQTTMDIYAEATAHKKRETFENLSKLDIF